jgi:hypothetical protein
MSNPLYHSARLEPTKKEYIEEVYENHDDYHSLKHFAEKAVANNISYIKAQLNGASNLRNLIKMLCRVDEVNITLPEKTLNTKIRGENLTGATKIDIAPQHLKSIDKITRSTKLSKGGVIRVCILRELNKVASREGLLHEPRQSDIQSSWEGFKEDTEDLFASLITKLETRLVTQFETTQQKVKRDPKAQDELIAHYQNYFRESAGYERLLETERGQEILSGLEDLPHGDG